MVYDKYENLPGVYIIKCLVNGKYYVGETLNVKARIRRYKKERTQIIGKALDKYGDDNFEIYVEYLPNFKKEDLLLLEEELIKKFNCLIPNGYNVCAKGINGVGRTHTDETKSKIGNAHKGKSVSLETRKKLSNNFKNKHHSESSIEKIRSKHNKPILQLDKDTEEVIKEWNSIKEATIALADGKNRAGDISKAIKGKRLKTALGFKWKVKGK